MNETEQTSAENLNIIELFMAKRKRRGTVMSEGKEGTEGSG